MIDRASGYRIQGTGKGLSFKKGAFPIRQERIKIHT